MLVGQILRMLLFSTLLKRSHSIPMTHLNSLLSMSLFCLVLSISFIRKSYLLTCHFFSQEFQDTLKYISSIRSKAEPYGICRIVPPSSWKPPCPLKEKSIWEGSKFSTRVQRIDKLQNRDSMRKMSKIQTNMKRKRRRCTRMGVDNSTRTGPNAGFCEVERFGFEPGPEFTLETFQRYAEDFQLKYFRKNENVSHLGANTTILNGTSEPSVENIEGEYWRMVESPTEEIEVTFHRISIVCCFMKLLPICCP